jgi:arsenite-transporting ATPase
MSKRPALTQLLSSRKLLFVTGKGGIGKSLVSAALAQAAAAAGRRVLIVESSARDQLAPLFGLEPVGHVETEVSRGISCINLNATGNFQEYVTKYLGQSRLFETVLSHRVIQSFFNTVPGLAEAMMLGRLYYTCDVRDPVARPDLVICDSPASGHFLSLMTTPDAILSSGLAGPMMRDTEKVRDFLGRKNECGVVYVCTPEPLVVSEVADFLPAIVSKSPSKLDAVVVNRIPPQLFVDKPVGDSRLLEYLVSRSDQAREALQSISGIMRSFPGVALTGLADQGFVSDPIAAGFYVQFLKEEALPV